MLLYKYAIPNIQQTQKCKERQMNNVQYHEKINLFWFPNWNNFQI